MYPFLEYLLQVSLLSLVFFLVYHFGFRNLAQFRLNRFYLLGSLAVSWIIPLVNLPLGSPEVISISTFPDLLPAPTPTESLADIKNPLTEEALPGPFPWWILYWVGTGFVILKSIWVITRIILLRWRKPSYRLDRKRIIVSDDIPAFSFGNWIFMNPKQHNGKPDPMILQHEAAHARQLHTLDLFFVELVQAFLWFNPLMILYKKRLKECHEYLADRSVLAQGVDLRSYTYSLQSDIMMGKARRLASYFKGSTLKKRVIMATQPVVSKTRLRYLWLIPVLTLSLISFSFISDPIEWGQHHSGDKPFTVVIDPGHGGIDPGSVNEQIGVSEKDILLGIARLMETDQYPALNIVFTRSNDRFMDLDSRSEATVIHDADIFISIHAGAHADKTRHLGTLINYSDKNPQSDQSIEIASFFRTKLNLDDFTSSNANQVAPFVVLWKSVCPAIMISIGNITNNEDCQLLVQPDIQKEIATQILDVTEQYRQARQDFEGMFPEPKWDIPNVNSWISPLPRQSVTGIAQQYALSRLHPILKISRPHTGIDYKASEGTDVYASDKGRITEIQQSTAGTGWGNYILIEHANGFETFYAHLQDILVEKGESVKQGQIIGSVGNTGLSLAPHLHFEMRRKGKAYNPNMMLSYHYDLLDKLRIASIDDAGEIFSYQLISRFASGKGLLQNEKSKLMEAEIDKVSKTYYLIALDKEQQALYAFELEREGKDLYINPVLPHFSTPGSTLDLDLFQVSGGRIITPHTK